ncbi:ThuA domain-containing protein [Solimonas sp. K1W22B-7]|nr:ThuA domain-containing protein [Solimonas sp. K1W22B-7]
MLGLAACDGASAAPATATQESFNLLVYSRTTGFRHNSIPDGIRALRELGQQNGFSVDATEDPAAFTPQNLQKYAAVAFLNTTGTVLEAPQKAAFEDYIRGGGGYVGVHSAADTEYDWPFYGELVGAWFKSHPLLPQSAVLVNEAPDQPSTAHLPARWRILIDEFYSFRSNPRGKVKVLLSLDEKTYLPDPNTSLILDFPNIVSGSMGDHPMSWCHENLGGRAWYTALGHEPASYSTERFRKHLLNGVLTVTHRVPADCNP